VSFDDFVAENFFKNDPERFWYVWGDIHNKLQRAEPHKGYEALKEITEFKKDLHWIYHDGVDKLYEEAGFDPKKLTYAKGNLSDWQCKPCNQILDDQEDEFLINRIEGKAQFIPECTQCGAAMRPNFSMRDDFDWLESKVEAQNERMNEFFAKPEVNKHSITVLEIGAGPAQPLAREFAELFLKNDKYRCALIRINPVKERSSQYRYELGNFN